VRVAAGGEYTFKHMFNPGLVGGNRWKVNPARFSVIGGGREFVSGGGRQLAPSPVLRYQNLVRGKKRECGNL
jgi:hypothetical protein